MGNYDETIHAIYDSALTPDNWPVALEKIGELFSARGAAIYFADETGGTDFIASPGLEEAVRIYQEEKWWDRDIHAHRAIEQQMVGGDVFDDFSVATPEEIETLPIFTDFFQRVGFGWLMGGVILPDLGMLASVSVPRAKEMGPFSKAEQEQLRLISRHVEQALRISLRIGSLETAHALLATVLDEIDAGLCLLDDAGHVLLENKVDWLQSSGLYIETGRGLVARDEKVRPAFAALLSSAHAEDAALVEPKSCILKGNDGRRYMAVALPLTPANQLRFGLSKSAMTLVLTTPAERGSLVDPTILRDLMNLSLGEARLASLIGAGATVREAAGRLGVTEGTARIVLKNIFRKTGINRQVELVLRIANIGQFRSNQIDGSD